MRRLLFALSFCFATIGYADPFQVNLQDKKESYQLGVETKLGTVHVASSFVGDPLVSPVTIPFRSRVRVQAEQELSLN